MTLALYEFMVHLLLEYQAQLWYPHLKKKKQKPVTGKRTDPWQNDKDGKYKTAPM